MHARMPKNFVLDQRIERAADAIETGAAAYRGRWAEACWPLGMGGAINETNTVDTNVRMPKEPNAEGVGADTPEETYTPERQAAGVSAKSPEGLGAAGPTRTPAHGQPFPTPAGTQTTRAQRFKRVHLDLGCGKGAYITAMAKRHPDTLFIGMDSEPVCVVHAAQLVLDEGLKNALVVPGDAAKLDRIFAPGELDAISINFPTPHPKRRYAQLRLTAAAHLEGYRPLLAPGAVVALRTDSRPLYEFSLPQFKALGWNILCATNDDRAAHPEQPITEYEERLTAQGATVNAIYATPSVSPATPQQLAAARELPQSLIDYLPDDLFESAYIPYGMSYAVENLRNRRAHEAARSRR